MVDSYIQLPIVVDADALTQQILSNLAAAFPGWVPREGNLEVALVEEIALLAAEAATAASDVPAAIFESFGTLVNIVPIAGNYEQVQVTWTLVSPATGAGYQIPAGTIAGFYWQGAAYQFQTVQDYVIANGQSSMNLIMQSVATGSVYDLDALATNSSFNTSQYLVLSTQDPLVSTILIINTPSTLPTLIRGTDPETPSAYLNRLANELQLLAPRPITPSDYSAFSQNVSGIYRATTYDGINPLTNQAVPPNDNLTIISSTPDGWTAIGDGDSVDTFSFEGSAPYAKLQVNRISPPGSLVTDALLYDTAAQGAPTMDVAITSPTFSTSLSPSNPALVLITDSTNGNEVVIVTGTTALSGGFQTLTLASPLLSAHPTTATVTIYDGVMLPVVGADPGDPGTLPSNTPNYIASVVTLAADDDAPNIIVAALAEYIDGSFVTFWSAPLAAAPPEALTTQVYVDSQNVYTTTNDLAGSNPSALYNSIKPTICSITMLVGWAGGSDEAVEYIYGSNVCQSPLFLLDGDDQPDLSTSFFNFVPDPAFNTYWYPNCNELTWTVGSGVTVLNGYGLQLSGTGSALGSASTTSSQAFMLDNTASDTGTATSRTYSLIATVDASYTGSTFDDITIEVQDLTDSTVLATVSPTAAGVQNLVASFTITGPKAVLVSVTFDSGLDVPLNSSVIVSGLGVMNGDQTPAYYTANNDLGYSYTPGGYYSTQNFVLARTVGVIPVTVNGLAVSDAQSDALFAYLQGRREVNFTTNILGPQYVPIDVEWSAYLSSGYSASAVQTAITTAIYDFLSPATWAGGGSAPPYWDPSQDTVRILDIGSIIAQVPGVSSVVSVLTRVSWPTSGDYDTSDITFEGVAVLPVGNMVSGTILISVLDQLSSI